MNDTAAWVFVVILALLLNVLFHGKKFFSARYLRQHMKETPATFVDGLKVFLPVAMIIGVILLVAWLASEGGRLGSMKEG